MVILVFCVRQAVLLYVCPRFVISLHIYLLQGGINALGVNLLKNATVWLNDLMLLQKVNDFLNYPSRESGISVLNELNKIKVKNCLSNKD